MENLDTLQQYIHTLLDIDAFSDYAPNGLQIQGKSDVKHIVTGVTASLALIEKAIELEADALLVHHGYFWKGEDSRIIGMKHGRIARLIKNDISLLGYHLPLDAHPEFGNNAQLAKRFEIAFTENLDPEGVGKVGEFASPKSLADFSQEVERILGRKPMVIAAGEHPIKSIAYCSGGAQGYISFAIDKKVDAYLSGEISEKTVHEARETGVHYIAAGHHATERYGIKALGEHLASKFILKHTFVDIDNPA
ncbi:MAG: FIG137478: Hypothetical protein YbgI [uncultured Thiotrichaceae bacterium]|uniref:GTP cyclohydrolase 1 type 2 homolog n=1 Tax=uncultured Thiotrichaceae bacterium TaxID=298394 RepID=A0A6S6SQL4_9GAMM|nr:MAG: FIG137478: Hypothetical protein YbgI [uncultured Thiotrichaceae bacterium]